MRKLTSIFLVIISFKLAASVSNLDSLNKVFLSSGKDTVRIKALLEMSEICEESEMAGYLFKADSMIDKLISTAAKDKAYLTRLNFFKASCKNNLGYYYTTIGNLDAAIGYYFAALKVFEEYKDKASELTTLVNLGSIYIDHLQLKKAKEVYHRSIKLSNETGNEKTLAYAYNFMGFVYSLEDSTEKSKNYYFLSLGIANKLSDAKGLAFVHYSISALFLKNIDSLQKAFFHASESLKYAQQIGEKRAIANAKNNLCGYYLKSYLFFGKKTGDLSLALKYARESFEISEELASPDISRNALSNLYKIYELKGDYKGAYEAFKKYKALNDSISSNEIKRKAFEKQVEYEYEMKQREMKLKQDLEVTKNEITKRTQRNVIVIVVLAFVVLLIFSFKLYLNFKQKKKDNDLITEQKKEVEEQRNIIGEKQKEILDSIYYAKRIQQALLVQEDELAGFIKDHFIYFKPKDIVSGDFYWATQKNNKFYLAVCDSTGHGVPGAFMSLLNMSLLSEAINEKEISEPHHVFHHIRNRLIELIGRDGQRDGFDGVLICIDQSNSGNGRRITYAAANNAPVLIKNRETIVLEHDRVPVGKSEKSESFSLFELSIQDGETLYLYTDGYADQFGGEKGKKFKSKKLNELLLEINLKSMQQQKAAISETFENWKGELEQIDDVCVIGLRL